MGNIYTSSRDMRLGKLPELGIADVDQSLEVRSFILRAIHPLTCKSVSSQILKRKLKYLSLLWEQECMGT